MQLLTFMLGTVKYGIPIQVVQSIEHGLEVTGIPNTLPFVKGITNLHGNIIPVYSLAERFGYKEQKLENIVVAEVRGMLVGFEVCKVDEILSVGGDHIIPMPKIVNHKQHYMKDVADFNKHLIVMLDVCELISEDEQEDLEKLVENEQ